MGIQDQVLPGLAWFLSRYLAVVAFFYMLSPLHSKAAFAARILATLLATIIAALYGVLASIVLSLVGKRQIAQWATARCYKLLMRIATGVVFEIDDPNGYLGSTRPAVFIGNHQTGLDVLMLGAVFPKYCSVTSKASLKWYPFLGWFMTLSGSIFINRANSKDARQAMSGAAKAIQSLRQSVFIFPEGTRSNAQKPELLPFKKGAFHLAVQAKVPIVPVVVANYSSVFSIKTFVFNSGTITVKGKSLSAPSTLGGTERLTDKVLAPISTENLTAEDVPELTQTTRELMLREHISASSSKAPKQPMAVPAEPKSNGHSYASRSETETRRTRRA
jgi:lysophosphatidate acyltransferase